MKHRSKAALAGLPLLVLSPLAFALANCGDGHAPHPYNDGTSPTSTAADAGPPPAFSFRPKGCAYTVSIPTTRPFTGYAADTATAPSDPSGAAPMRVRVGLAGGTTKPVAGDAGAASADGGAASDYADPTTTASILWETTSANTNAKVRIGTAPGTFGTIQSGFVYTSPPPSSGFGSSDPSGYFHQVDVCGLTPGTTYYYQVGGGAAGSEIWSATQSFATVPAPGNPITVGLFGDARDLVSTWQAVNERMRSAAPNLLLISGDIVDIGAEQSLFDQWLDAIWKDPSDAGTGFVTLGQFMTVPVAGNHENDSSQYFANFSIPGAGSYAKQYTSFDVGNTHFVMVDDQPIAEFPTAAPAAALLAWLEADLKAADADRANHPFIVEVSHRGLFSTSNHAADFDVIQARTTMAPLFSKYNVNLVMNGHDHEYERSKPLTAGSPPSGPPVVQTSVSQGTTYVINAGAGADPYAVGTASSNYRQGDPTPLGSLSPKGYIGCYVLLTLAGQTMTLTAYGMKASGTSYTDDDVIDTVVFGQ
jgi:hypothetical protein